MSRSRSLFSIEEVDMPAKQKQVPFRTVEFRYTRIHVAVREAVKTIGHLRAFNLHALEQEKLRGGTPPAALLQIPQDAY